MSTSSTILIIEDDQGIIDVFTCIIEEAGFKVIISSSENCFDDISTYKPSIILLDYWIEHTLGSDICISLKADPTTRHIPIILTSAVNGIQEIAKECKADDVLPKPFDIKDLETKILKWSVLTV